VGKDHLHHRLADALGSRRGSVMFIYLMGIGLGISALMLRYASGEGALLLILQAGILVVLVTVLERRGRIQSERREGDSLTDLGAGGEKSPSAARNCKNFDLPG
jgi:hypothetical protein